MENSNCDLELKRAKEERERMDVVLAGWRKSARDKSVQDWQDKQLKVGLPTGEDFTVIEKWRIAATEKANKVNKKPKNDPPAQDAQLLF